MTPAARLSTAIDILDQILSGQPAGLTLTNWGRQNRYAGSRDRAAIRDIVFDCLRSLRSLSAQGGAQSGRAIILAYALREGLDMDGVFTGEKYDPDPLTQAEREMLAADVPMADPVKFNYPDFLDELLKQSLGTDFEAVMEALLVRAPVDLRVNRAKGDLAAAQAILSAEDIATVPVDGVPTALRVTQNQRRVGQSKAYRDGLVELQDASSQAAALFARAAPGMRVLDYCAGGGGKALALYDAIGGDGGVIAHDIATVRMSDLPTRAARAGARITVASPKHKELVAGAFDLVFVDAPCSGSGSWRRTPDAKWRFQASDLESLLSVQSDILDRAARYVRPGGTLCYATCSFLQSENLDQVSAFVERNGSFSLQDHRLFTPLGVGDGFFAARLIFEN